MIQNIIHEINTAGKDYIVGDIHGCWEQLQFQMKLVGFDKSKDRLFSVGDLIDRGPDNEKVLSLLQESWFFPVRGNHEDFMIDALLSEHPRFDISVWYRNGGSWFVRADLERMRRVANELETKVPLTRTVLTKYGRLGICHAQPPCRNWKDCEDQRLNDHQIATALWSRSLIESDLMTWKCENVDLTIHGHTPVKEYHMVGNALFIDTGSFMKEFGYNEYPGVRILRIDDIIKNMGDRL